MLQTVYNFKNSRLMLHTVKVWIKSSGEKTGKRNGYFDGKVSHNIKTSKYILNFLKLICNQVVP